MKLTLTCVAFKRYLKNSLVGFADITIAELRMTLKNVTLHRRGDSRWASPPGCAWIKDGQLNDKDVASGALMVKIAERRQILLGLAAPPGHAVVIHQPPPPTMTSTDRIFAAIARIKALPKVDILDRLFVRGAQAIALPIADPGHDAVAQILTVGVQIDPAWFLERFKRRNRGHQLHAVVGRIRLAAFKLLLVVAKSQDSAPAAGSGISGTGTVGVNDDMRQWPRQALRHFFAHGSVAP